MTSQPILSSTLASRICKYAALGYVLAWGIGLSAGGPSLALDASATTVIHEITNLQMQSLLQFGFAEGVAGVLLLVVVLSAVRTPIAMQASALVRKQFQLVGILAAGISLLMFALSMVLILHTASSGTNQEVDNLFQTINRLDGPKMWMLALMALYGIQMVPTLPRWIKFTGYALAFALIVSGISYILLAQSIAWTVYISGVLLLVWVGAFGIAVAGQSAHNSAKV